MLAGKTAALALKRYSQGRCLTPNVGADPGSRNLTTEPVRNKISSVDSALGICFQLSADFIASKYHVVKTEIKLV